jgi:uncharacterized protein (TIGR03067 family)
MRRMILLAGVLLSVVALGSDSPKEYDDRAKVLSIEGTWRLIQTEDNGKKNSTPYPEVTTFSNGVLAHNDDSSRHKYRIDPTAKPSHLDLLPISGKGEAERCIYQIDGDTLRIASFLFVFDGEETRRPQGFGGDNVWVATYKRVK